MLDARLTSGTEAGHPEAYVAIDFFDDAATPAGTSQLTANPSANNFYYEKTCIPNVSAHEACTYRSFSFERARNTQLEGLDVPCFALSAIIAIWGCHSLHAKPAKQVAA